MLTKIVLPAALFLITLVFGFWLRTMGKPYNGILFNVHKLAALGAVILSVVLFSRQLGTSGSLVWIMLLLGTAVLSVIALFASGAFLSIGTLNDAMLLTVHRIAVMALTVSLSAAVFLLSKPS